jgi:thymidylate synthase (FAD)
VTTLPEAREFKFYDKMFVTTTRVEGEDLDIARAAWASTKGERAEDEQDSAKVKGLINALMRERHGSPFEQCGFQFLTKAPIFVWREHMRHRMASYNEQSGRYSILAPEFYFPARDRNLVQTGKSIAYSFEPGTKFQVEFTQRMIKQRCTLDYNVYLNLLQAGIAKEVARMVLPVNIYSTAYVRMNLRALMNFLSLRTKDSTATFPSNPQREIEMVAEQYEQAFMDHFPITWEAWDKNGRVAP